LSGQYISKDILVYILFYIYILTNISISRKERYIEKIYIQKQYSMNITQRLQVTFDNTQIQRDLELEEDRLDIPGRSNIEIQSSCPSDDVRYFDQICQQYRDKLTGSFDLPYIVYRPDELRWHLVHDLQTTRTFIENGQRVPVVDTHGDLIFVPFIAIAAGIRTHTEEKLNEDAISVFRQLDVEHHIHLHGEFVLPNIPFTYGTNQRFELCHKVDNAVELMRRTRVPLVSVICTTTDKVIKVSPVDIRRGIQSAVYHRIMN
jgi:hypothetical protein